jgi:hypothetical protein
MVYNLLKFITINIHPLINLLSLVFHLTRYHGCFLYQTDIEFKYSALLLYKYIPYVLKEYLKLY